MIAPLRLDRLRARAVEDQLLAHLLDALESEIPVARIAAALRRAIAASGPDWRAAAIAALSELRREARAPRRPGLARRSLERAWLELRRLAVGALELVVGAIAALLLGATR